METYVNLRQCPELAPQAACWFHERRRGRTFPDVRSPVTLLVDKGRAGAYTLRKVFQEQERDNGV